MNAAPDISQFRFALMRLINAAQRAGVDAGECAAVWTDAQALCRALEISKLGVRAETIKQAAEVARLDDQLRGLDPDERLGAIMDRLDMSRARVFRLRKVARSLTKVDTGFSVST